MPTMREGVAHGGTRLLGKRLRIGRHRQSRHRLAPFPATASAEGALPLRPHDHVCAQMLSTWTEVFLPSPSTGEGEGGGEVGPQPDTLGHPFPPIPTFPRQGGRRGKPVQKFMSQYLVLNDCCPWVINMGMLCGFWRDG